MNLLQESDLARLIRLRRETGTDSLAPADTPRLRAGQALPGNPRFLASVTAAGGLPKKTGRTFLVHPVQLEGEESEGGAATTFVDTARTIPVLVVGTRPPGVGDLLVAVSVGGRWVAESGVVAAGSLRCSPCPIPRIDLILSWTNPLIGNGSTPLKFSPPGTWSTSCTLGLQYGLSCQGGTIEFAVTYYVGGSCLSDQPQTFTSVGQAQSPFSLDPPECRPLYLRYRVSARDCPTLAQDGYSAFTVTE